MLRDSHPLLGGMCLAVKYRAKGVMTITAPKGAAAPHSIGVHLCGA
jgi:hypothetical protein